MLTEMHIHSARHTHCGWLVWVLQTKVDFSALNPLFSFPPAGDIQDIFPGGEKTALEGSGKLLCFLILLGTHQTVTEKKKRCDGRMVDTF